jgi:hypothetical protein
MILARTALIHARNVGSQLVRLLGDDFNSLVAIQFLGFDVVSRVLLKKFATLLTREVNAISLLQ